MTRAALIWSSGDTQKLAELHEGSPTVVGRAPESDVRIDDPTVSRKQAVFSEEAGHYVLENVSQTNVAKVNGVAVDRPVPLTDRDSLNLGVVQLTFHDLQAGDRLSGPLCSHCSRENMGNDKDCWYCGTSLVNAPTAILSKKKVVFRIVAAGGQAFDVHAGETFFETAPGEATLGHAEQVPENPGLVISPEGDKNAKLISTGSALTVNGNPPAGDSLHTGDVLSTGAGNYLVIVR